MTSKFSLTIVIPTYNRNLLLLETVKVLLPQLGNGVNLVILDNCSPTPVAETLAPYLAGYPISVVRNKCNIGADANVVRCFEQADGEWVWVVADDDDPDPKAIETIKRTIDSHPGLGMMNFYVPCAAHPVRTNTKISSGLAQYIRNMDDFGAHLFLPSSVYRTAPIQKFIKIAHRNIHTLAAHAALALCYMREGGIACQSSDTIVRFKASYTAAVGWSRLAFGLGCASLADLVWSAPDRRLLRQKIASFLPFKTMYAEALVISVDRSSDRYGYFMYRTAVARMFSGGISRRRYILGQILSLSLLFPKATFAAASFIGTTIRRRPLNVTKMQASPDMLSFYWKP